MNIPVAFIVYKRPETTRRVFEAIRESRPRKIYLIADGPKTPNLASACTKVRQIVEDNIDWSCDLSPIYSETNLGLARRVQTGLDEVFAQEEAAIILEDDTLPHASFFRYCQELLERYTADERIAHVSGCNPHSEAYSERSSYCFSSIFNVWGWATWRRAWKCFDLQMKSWADAPQDEILRKWCHDKRERKGTRSMFDLHCRNDDPWAWSYQWKYACWAHDSLSAMPSRNLVSNLGIGPGASNTTSAIPVPLFPKKLESMTFPMKHPSVKRDTAFERNYHHCETLPFARRLKNRLKSLLTIVLRS